MTPFTYHNPVRIEFGEGAISRLSRLIPPHARVMLLAGGGSIRTNGSYDQVVKALGDRIVEEFWGIEANPQYETLMRAVARVKSEDIDFLLAVGGGSVLDGTKFVAAAACFEGSDPWKICSDRAPVVRAIPLGAVLTLPATGSEMNSNSVVSKAATGEKLYFASPRVFPVFSILDPATTVTLPVRQTANGIVDAFVHVLEQYLTFPTNAPLQDRQAEAVLLTLIEEGPKVLADANDLEARANVMWAATNALNGLIGVGVPQDWATHGIGHELTALYGLDHAQTLAVILPGVWEHRFEAKREKLAHYGRRVWNLQGDTHSVAQQAIARTEAFFNSLGVATKLSGYKVSGSEASVRIRDRFQQRQTRLGEGGVIGAWEAASIVLSRA
jgi:NADP-dependent alcohol dehydrogenase